MNKKVIYAFVLLGLTALVLVFNCRGWERVSVDLIVTSVKYVKSLIFLGFIAIGVLIGVLIK